MPEIYCRKCGTLAQPTDLYCRICGSPLDSKTVAEEGTQDTKPEQGRKGLVGSGVRSSLESPKSRRTAWTLAVVGLLLLTFAWVMGYFIVHAYQPGGKPAIAIELVGTSTPYPTRRPYPTAGFYETSTPYPTAVPYPTTGALATTTPTPPPTQSEGLFIRPSSPSIPLYFGGCSLTIKNQFTNLDSVVILADADTDTIEKAAYVRANDTFFTSGIAAGTYDMYVALGLDWDSATSRFMNNPSYFRFKDPAVFTTCPMFRSLYGGGWQYLTITLNTAESSGADISDLSPYDFPRLSP